MILVNVKQSPWNPLQPITVWSVLCVNTKKVTSDDSWPIIHVTVGFFTTFTLDSRIPTIWSLTVCSTLESLCYGLSSPRLDVYLRPRQQSPLQPQPGQSCGTKYTTQAKLLFRVKKYQYSFGKQSWNVNDPSVIMMCLSVERFTTVHCFPDTTPTYCKHTRQ